MRFVVLVSVALVATLSVDSQGLAQQANGPSLGSIMSRCDSNDQASCQRLEIAIGDLVDSYNFYGRCNAGFYTDYDYHSIVAHVMTWLHSHPEERPKPLSDAINDAFVAVYDCRH